MVIERSSSNLSAETLSKIKQLTFCTRRMIRNQMAGGARSKIKGIGFDFDALREYQMGDDIRFIDWHASNRMSQLLVKQFYQEKDHTIMLVIDISASLFYGTSISKRELISEIAYAIALIAIHTKDALGLILFSEEIELYIPPSKLRNRLNVILEALFSWQPKGKRTASKPVYECLMKHNKKNQLVFWFSDCIENEFISSIKNLPARHDVYVLRYLDKFERTFPSIGTIWIEDVEQNLSRFVTLDHTHTTCLQNRVQEQNELIKRSGCKMIDINNFNDALQKVIALFSKRMRM
ncbi:DUF58 domain-containing protein [bacterium]|nr:MAG: DUF58 domain-containing protein [bacterium]QQR61981.1 MAG: DUF58 domain-containing protein [bacterium]QQR62426.1 MAG: DUF58 domain-containing protein [bacterium]